MGPGSARAEDAGAVAEIDHAIARSSDVGAIVERRCFIADDGSFTRAWEVAAEPFSIEMVALAKDDARAEMSAAPKPALENHAMAWRGDRVREMDCRLTSESLGSLDVKLRLAAGAVDLSITVSKPETLPFFVQQRELILESLRGSGVTPGSLDFAFDGSRQGDATEGSSGDGKRRARPDGLKATSSGEPRHDEDGSAKVLGLRHRGVRLL
jgi:hypothetical protein